MNHPGEVVGRQRSPHRQVGAEHCPPKFSGDCRIDDRDDEIHLPGL